MTKKILIVLMILMLITPLVFLVGCNSSYEVRPYLEKPDGLDLLFWVTDPMPRDFLTKYREYDLICSHGFGCDAFIDVKDYYSESLTPSDVYEIPSITYSFSGFPDSSDAYHCTRIKISLQDIQIYGLTINSSQEEIEQKMLSIGFIKIENVNPRPIQFIKDRVIFSFEPSYSIAIFVKTTNERHVVF